MDLPAVMEMFLKNWASEIRKARKKGRRGKKGRPKDLSEHGGKMARRTLPELPYTTFTVMIHWVSNGKDMVLAPKQCQAWNTDVRHWEELVDFIDKMAAQNSHTSSHQLSSAPWSRMNWTKRIWEYTNMAI
jgi:hypothetical protein